MFRATTPTHTWVIPFDTSVLKTVRITYQQDGEIILQKTETDCTFDGNKISVTLTQQETLLFKSDTDKRVSIQLRVLTKDGVAMASHIEKVWAWECLDEEVLT